MSDHLVKNHNLLRSVTRVMNIHATFSVLLPGGARPKTIHLASRQQSINQSSALTVMNLKQNQVDILKSEIESMGGLVKAISKVHFQSGLALVECFNKIW